MTMQRDDLQDTKERLNHWGVWLRTGVSRSLSYPTSAAFVKANNNAPPPLYQPDPEAEEIEKLLLMLEKRNERLFTALVHYYYLEHPSESIARRLHVSRRRFFEMKKEGERFIDGCLCVKAA